MADWYEVFDNEEVQQSTQRAVSRALVFCGLAVGIALALVFAAVAFSPWPLVTASVVFVGLAIALGMVSQELLRQRRVVWCVKLSVHRVVGYDYARRKTVLPWCEIERLDVDRSGLFIIGHAQQGRTGPTLCVPTLFPNYARLSHRVVEYAEAHGIPVCIEGRPWQLVDLTTLYPFMADDRVIERPGGPGALGRDALD